MNASNINKQKNRLIPTHLLSLALISWVERPIIALTVQSHGLGVRSVDSFVRLTLWKKHKWAEAITMRTQTNNGLGFYSRVCYAVFWAIRGRNGLQLNTERTLQKGVKCFFFWMSESGSMFAAGSVHRKQWSCYCFGKKRKKHWKKRERIKLHRCTLLNWMSVRRQGRMDIIFSRAQWLMATETPSSPWKCGWDPYPLLLKYSSCMVGCLFVSPSVVLSSRQTKKWSPICHAMQQHRGG